MTMGKMTWAEAELHAGRLLHTNGIFGEVYDAAAKAMPHYLFTKGDEKHREGWCSACQKWVGCGKTAMKDQIPYWVQSDPYLADDDEEQPFIPFAGIRKVDFDRWYGDGSTQHGYTGYCPECGERVRFHSIAKGYRSMYDRRFLIRYAKSGIDPKHTVVCVGYRLENEWRQMDECAPELPLKITPLEICVFRYGDGGERFVREQKWFGIGGWQWQWSHRRECRGGFAPGIYSNTIQMVLDQYSFREAVDGTPFEISTNSGSEIWNTHAAMMYDRIDIMDALAKYPCLEYLFKLDQDEIAVAAINKRIGNKINRRGKTAREVLRLSADDWGEVKGKRLSLTPDALDIHRLARRRKWKMNMELIAWCGHIRGWAEKIRKISRMLPGADMPRMMKYCRKNKISVGDYEDHVSMMCALGMSQQDSEFLTPRDFSNCHHELAIRLGDVKDSQKTAKIQGRIQSGILDGYFFSAAGLTLRPAFTAAEIVAEGNYLKHCVAGYVDRYAEGGTIICFLRNDSELNKPRYTVEFAVDGRLVQCRGYHNDLTDEAKAQKEADKERLELFWRLHRMYRNDLARQQKRERRRNAA